VKRGTDPRRIGLGEATATENSVTGLIPIGIPR
jgi:hypothetical protein